MDGGQQDAGLVPPHMRSRPHRRPTRTHLERDEADERPQDVKQRSGHVLPQDLGGRVARHAKVARVGHVARAQDKYNVVDPPGDARAEDGDPDGGGRGKLRALDLLRDVRSRVVVCVSQSTGRQLNARVPRDRTESGGQRRRRSRPDDGGESSSQQNRNAPVMVHCTESSPRRNVNPSLLQPDALMWCVNV